MEPGPWTEADWSGSPFSIASDWSLGVDFEPLMAGFDGTPNTTAACHPRGLPMLETSPACGDSVDMAARSSSLGKGNHVNEEDDKGLRLVHLLMAAAEAIGEEDMGGKDLARAILVRLKELVSPSGGTNMERLAASFTRGLQHLLQGPDGLGQVGPDPSPPHVQVLCAFQLLQEISPFMKFGHFTANQAIIESVHSERGVHIIDYDVMDGMQWAPLIWALRGRSVRLRISAVVGTQHRRRCLATVSETGRRLASFAESIGQPFSFHKCRLDSEGRFHPESVKLVKGEVVMVNCMMHLGPHKSPAGSVRSFLTGSMALNPRPTLVTLLEETNQYWSYDEGFMNRFMGLLHHYSTIYDSMEANELQHGPSAWLLVEPILLGPMIESSLAQLREKGDQGTKRSCLDWMVAEGFKAQEISSFNRCQAKLLIDLFGNGYNVEYSKNKLILGWKTRPLLAASVWTFPCS